MAFPTDGLIGATLGSTSTDQRFALGQRIMGDNGSVWVYVQAGMAILQYDFITYNHVFSASQLMGANVGAGHQIGTAQIAFAASDYGWVCISGSNLYGNVVANASYNDATFASATTGRIECSGTGLNEIQGISISGSSGTSGATLRMALTNPVVDLT